MRSQRYDVFSLDADLLDPIEGTFETETTTVEVTAVDDSPTEYKYEHRNESPFGTTESEGHLFLVDHPTEDDAAFLLLGYGFSSGLHETIPRAFFETLRGLDPETHRYDLTTEEQWWLVENADGVMFNVATIDHPVYGKDDLWDMAEEIAMGSRKDFDAAMSDLRDEVLEERYPVTSVDLSFEEVCDGMRYEAPARFSPEPRDGEDRFTPESATAFVDVLARMRAETREPAE